MSFQSRIFLAVALCALILFVFQSLAPPPPPPEAVAEGDAKVTETTKDGEPSKDEGDEEAEEAEAEAAPAPDMAPVDPEDHQLHSELLALQVTNRAPGRGGLVSGVNMLSPQFEGHATATDTLGLAGKRTLEVVITDGEGDPLVPRGAAYRVREVDQDRITLVYEGAKVEVIQRLELLGSYEGRLEVEVKNRGTQALQQQVHVRTRIGDSESRYDIRRGLCRTAEDVEDEDKSDVEDGPIEYGGPILWGGVDSKYFTSLVVPKQPVGACEIALAKDGKAVETRLRTDTEEVAAGLASTHVFGLYIGPKELERLRDFGAVDPGVSLEQAIDWGFFGGVSEWLGKMLLALLRWFHDLVDNWGLSIVLLTVLIKLVTLPLTLKQMSSMKRMKEVQPELNKLKEKYKDDRVKQGQEMQALFARSGVNPLAGCFPMLVQLPIWFALYSMLGAAVELVHEPFLWLPDLTEQDPYYILPLALGALMILQNRMMPSTMDAAQAKLMRWVMPIMFTVFMLFLPSGLGVYIFANIVLSLIQTAIQVGTTNKDAQAKA